MEWIEIRAKSVADAVERALDTLGVHESELEYTVVQEAKSSMLGLRRVEAHIRARVRPVSREKPNDRRRRGRDGAAKPGRKSSSDGRKAQADGATTEVRDGASATGSRGSHKRGPDRGSATQPGDPQRPATKSRDENGSQRPRTAGLPAGLAPTGSSDATGDTDDDGTASTAPRRRRSRGGRGRGTGQSNDGIAKNDESNSQEADVVGETLTVEELATASHDYVVGLIDAFDIEATVDVETTEESVDVLVTGPSLGLLVGPKGATLAAIEELMRDSVGHRASRVRLHLDVAGYRAQRREALAGFARKVAAQVASTGSATALEPMSASDRKIVHDTVAEIDGVATISDGEDPRRRVVIKPA